MPRQVSLSLLRQPGPDQSRLRGWVRPSFGRMGLRAVEPLLDSANRLKAQLACMAGDAEGLHKCLPGLRPLSTADG